MPGPLNEFGPGLWVGKGPVVSFNGFPYPTRMAVMRLSDGGRSSGRRSRSRLNSKQAVDALGPVRFLVSPNSIHHLFLGAWKAAYPEARMVASPNLRKKRPDLTFDGDLGDAPDPGWAADIDQVPVKGSPFLTEVVFFHRASGTAIFTDLIQNFPRDWFKGWRGVVARIDGIVAPHPGAPREWRASFFFKRAEARASLERILAWPIERVLIAHGDPVSSDGVAFVRKASPGCSSRDRTQPRWRLLHDLPIRVLVDHLAVAKRIEVTSVDFDPFALTRGARGYHSGKLSGRRSGEASVPSAAMRRTRSATASSRSRSAAAAIRDAMRGGLPELTTGMRCRAEVTSQRM